MKQSPQNIVSHIAATTLPKSADSEPFIDEFGVVFSVDGNRLISAPKDILSYSVPDGVIEIEKDAFNGCRSLETLHIPDSVKVIGVRAFLCCSSLVEVRLPDGLPKIPSAAFQECSSLKCINLPRCTVEVEMFAFVACSSLTEVVIPPNEGLCIGDWAFARCSNLATVSLPGGVERFGEGVFEDCDSLTLCEIGEGYFVPEDILPSECELTTPEESRRRRAQQIVSERAGAGVEAVG